jgi:hypothetical protein
VRRYSGCGGRRGFRVSICDPLAAFSLHHLVVIRLNPELPGTLRLEYQHHAPDKYWHFPFKLPKSGTENSKRILATDETIISCSHSFSSGFFV